MCKRFLTFSIKKKYFSEGVCSVIIFFHYYNLRDLLTFLFKTIKILRYTTNLKKKKIVPRFYNILLLKFIKHVIAHDCAPRVQSNVTKPGYIKH